MNPTFWINICMALGDMHEWHGSAPEKKNSPGYNFHTFLQLINKLIPKWRENM